MSSPPFKVKAVFEYTSPHDDDLHFPNGQIITVVEEEDEDWYVGEYVDASGVKQEGLFPKNFVEKYEPVAPARPNRAARPPKDADPAPAPIPEPLPKSEPEPVKEEAAPEPEVVAPPPAASVVRQPSPQPEITKPPPAPRVADVSSPPPQKATPAVAKSSAPPPASEKPSGNSFKDRIAAFNKATPPPAPFKPGGLGSGGPSSFIRKPFVAPPPSKNAYVPPPREPVQQKVYRRDEDPEITARETENHEQAEKAGLVPSNDDAEEDDQPKPLTLKERMALLQKQQAEQAARHADAAAKKEKPRKPPPKKRTESQGPPESTEDGEGAALEKQDTTDTLGKPSIDSVREEPVRRRKSTHPQESVGDGNEADMSGAGDTTEEHEASTERDSDENPRSKAPGLPLRAPSGPSQEQDVGEEKSASEGEAEGVEDEEEEEEEDDIDPEIRRKEELRARMAKMSGGMGMHGMFGAPMPGPPPPKKKQSTSDSRRSDDYGSESAPTASKRALPVPMPGLSRVRSPEEIPRQLDGEDEEQTPIAKIRPADEVPDVEDVVPERAPPPSLPNRETGAPPIPAGRPAPPPLPLETRPTPTPKPMSPSAGSESDDELSERGPELETPTVGPPRPPPREPELPPSSPDKSYFGNEPTPSSPTTPGANKDRRTSKVPPIPGAAAPQSRAPPPPPPGGLSRSSTGDHFAPPPKSVAHDLSNAEQVTDYDGDYDTDMGSGVHHKDALKAHPKESEPEDTSRQPLTSPPGPPPIPTAPRAVPPPLPSQPPPNSRRSVDMPRAAPPPPPPGKMPAPWEQDDEDEYDPYKYVAPPSAPPRQAPPSAGIPTPKLERRESDLYSASPPRSYATPARPQQPPPQATSNAPPPPPSSNLPLPRQSIDIAPGAPIRRSTDLNRMSMDPGYLAKDVDLGKNSFWWTQPKGVPPVYQGRADILLNFDESSEPSPDGRTIVTKVVFVLFQDYSQSIVSAEFDATRPGEARLEQRQELPPGRLRQDQLEEAHGQYGAALVKAAASKAMSTIGDGTPQGLVTELLTAHPNALPPIGTRAYGAIVYSNFSNSSSTQNDEIRPGDIITLRNARFQGKHGPMHAKYTMNVGKPDHVAIVAEWDGTKKKVRAWEQGRESKKIKMESFKLDDLRVGEVKIWRVMGRGWVGWRSD